MANDYAGQMQVMEFRGRRRWWPILGMVVVTLLAGLWFVVDQANAEGWVLLVCGAVVLIVWMSLVAPGAFYLKLAPEGMKISDNWWRRSYRWNQIQHIRPVEIDGQPSVGWNFVPSFDWLEEVNLFAGIPPIEGWLVLETYGQKAETLADIMFERHSAHAGPASRQKLTATLPVNWSWLIQEEGHALAQSLQSELDAGDLIARHVAASRGRLAGLLSRFSRWIALLQFASLEKARHFWGWPSALTILKSCSKSVPNPGTLRW